MSTVPLRSFTNVSSDPRDLAYATMRNGSCSTTIWTHLVNDEVENVKKARWSGPMEQAVSLFGSCIVIVLVSGDSILFRSLTRHDF